MQRTNEPVDTDRESTDSPSTVGSGVDSQSRSNRGLILATVGLALFMFVWLVQRPPFPLAPTSVPNGVTIAVQSGSTGVQDSGTGPLWWVSSVPALIGVANESHEPAVVAVSMLVTNGPCAVTRRVDFNGKSYDLGAGAAVAVSSGPIELDGFERLSLPLNLGGEPCAPTSVEPRPLVAALSNLEAEEIEK